MANDNSKDHVEWYFRNEAVIWLEGMPLGPNFYPLATELRNWMLRQGSLSYLTAKDKLLPQAPTNQYTYDGSILALTYSQLINESSDFSKPTQHIDPTEAEIKRIRYYTEHVSYVARLCEVLIKQLLFCTNIGDGNYRGSALGSLLSKNCTTCQECKDKRHRISLLGSLAHRYHLCGEYELCLHEHVKIANRRREMEAAHSGVTQFKVQSAEDARKQLHEDLTKSGNELIHMLRHISDIEEKMAEELNTLIAANTPRARLIFKREDFNNTSSPALETPQTGA